MKRLFFVSVSLIFAILFCASCDSELGRNKIVGKWTQVELRSQLGQGEPELSEDRAVWTFNDDSTYSIEDGEGTEHGRWELQDSSIVLVVDGMDSLNISYKVLQCSNDSMLQQSTAESDFGLITETTKLIKEE